jgi:hypothetical protein
MKTGQHAQRDCDICGWELITRRRVTRTTYVCPFSTDQRHRDERRIRKLKAEVAEIERHIGGQSQ